MTFNTKNLLLGVIFKGPKKTLISKLKSNCAPSKHKIIKEKSFQKYLKTLKHF